MKKTIRDTGILLDALEVELRRGRFHPAKKPRSIIGWKGPGVTFATRVPGRRRGSAVSGSRLVISSHAHAAGNLLGRIDEAFSPLLREHIKWDFFERIAEGVTEYTAFIPPGQDTEESFLRVILREARDILDEMEKGDFPSVHFDEKH